MSAANTRDDALVTHDPERTLQIRVFSSFTVSFSLLADLPPEIYTYRAGRNDQQAVVEVEELLFRGHPDVVDADLADYFGSRSPASGSRTRSHAFTHDGLSGNRARSEKSCLAYDASYTGLTKSATSAFVL